MKIFDTPPTPDDKRLFMMDLARVIKTGWSIRSKGSMNDNIKCITLGISQPLQLKVVNGWSKVFGNWVKFASEVVDLIIPKMEEIVQVEVQKQ